VSVLCPPDVIATRALFPDGVDMKSRRIVWSIRGLIVAALAAGLFGCDDGQAPVAILAAATVTGPVPLEIAFDLSHTYHPQRHAMSFELDFGDGAPIAEGTDFDLIQHHEYAQAGVYGAVLTVIDDRGDRSVDRLDITADQGGPPIGILTGDTAPDFTAHTTDGATVTLSDHRGEVVLLDFWGAWCPPCRSSMPHLDDLVETYGRRGLVAIVVSTDPAESTAVAFLEDHGYDSFISVWEPGGKSGNRIAELFGVSGPDVGIPRTYVIDRQGVIRYVGHPMELTRTMLETLL
jgi:peroxiredoxin